MSWLDNLATFKSRSEPFIGFWSVADAQAYGALVWSNESPVLTLTLEVDARVARDFDKADLTILRVTHPSLQPTITTTAPKLGVITLERCARSSVRLNHNLETGRAVYELVFFPSAVWVGDPKGLVDAHTTSVVASDTRLVGFFGVPGLNTYRSYDAAVKEIFAALGEPQTVWAVNGPNHHEIEIGNTGWRLEVQTDSIETFSATEGHMLRSTVNVTLHSSNPSTISDASRLLRKLEDILSTFSIEAFNFQFEHYQTQEGKKITPIWRLGENHSLFKPPMHHQVLIDLGDLPTLREVCKQWFDGSPNTNLARWLFVRALRETADGLARFVAVAQAFEVLGRDLGNKNKMSKRRLWEAIDAIQNALVGNFEDSFVRRITNLVRSSNKSSYSDILHELLCDVAKKHGLGTDANVRQFSKLVADTRNAVIHMTDDDQGSLDSSFARINKLSYCLCFWFAVCQANQMQLNVPDLRAFLANNRNARHGLPNEILDTH